MSRCCSANHHLFHPLDRLGQEQPSDPALALCSGPIPALAPCTSTSADPTRSFACASLILLWVSRLLLRQQHLDPLPDQLLDLPSWTNFAFASEQQSPVDVEAQAKEKRSSHCCCCVALDWKDWTLDSEEGRGTGWWTDLAPHQESSCVVDHWKKRNDPANVDFSVVVLALPFSTPRRNALVHLSTPKWASKVGQRSGVHPYRARWARSPSYPTNAPIGGWSAVVTHPCLPSDSPRHDLETQSQSVERRAE